MITLTTGVPGSGKTLYSLNYVEDLRKKSGRTVYQNGIKDLTLPWEVLEDPEKWYELPPNSIIVIDEAQRIFRPRGNGAAVPPHVAELETHRHKGIDIFVITQHPMLIDSNIRRLVGQHFHVIRRFGGHRAVINEWSSCTEISKSSVMEAVRHDFRYPKESFNWYKSAEVHTHKRRIPMRMVFLWCSPLLLGALCWWAWSSLHNGTWGNKKSAAELAAVEAAAKSPGYGKTGTGGPAVLSKEEYALQYVPRVKGLAHTAPVYDKVTAVIRAPVPSACIASSSACRCSSQDGTYMAVPEELCRAIVDKGYFVNFEPGSGRYAGTLGSTSDSSTARQAQQQTRTPSPAAGAVGVAAGR